MTLADTFNICGIYALQNILTGESYVGSSTNIGKRVTGHHQRLRRNKHSSRHLQHSWNKYGEESFAILLLDRCTEKELLVVEQMFIDCMGTLNCSKTAGPSGRIQTVEQRAEHSLTLKLAWKEGRLKGTPRSGVKHAPRKFKMPLALRKRLSIAQKLSWKNGKRKSPVRHPPSDATKAKISAAITAYHQIRKNGEK